MICSSVVLEALGPEFDEYIYLPTIDARGGILLAWKSRDVSITNPEFTTNMLSAQVATHSGPLAPWWLTIVYGPQSDAEKVEFLHEIHDLRAACPGPWMLYGDLKLIYRDEDNNNNLDRRMMGRFRRVLNDLALKEVYLNDRYYTCSNERPLSPPDACPPR